MIFFLILKNDTKFPLLDRWFELNYYFFSNFDINKSVYNYPRIFKLDVPRVGSVDLGCLRCFICDKGGGAGVGGGVVHVNWAI